MRKLSGSTNSGKDSSKKVPDTSEERYVFVRYSVLMDLRQNVKDASIVLSRIAKSVSDTKLTSMRSEAKERLSQRLMDISGTKRSTQLDNKISEAEESEKDMVKTWKYIVSHFQDSAVGQTKKSPKK
jgi:hypothetical protein